MSLSAHLVDQYEDRKPIIPAHLRPGQRPESPNPMQVRQDPDQSWYSNHGNTSANMSGARTPWSQDKLEQLQARLARKLGPEYITQRPGPGGGPKLSYIEGWKVINLANEVFGFNGWSSSITQLTVDYLDVTDQGRCSVSVTAIVRITLQDGCFHEDVGAGQGENIKGKGAALDKAKKEAVTDATKRALKTFGNVLGNCLYDKEYTKEVVKMRVPLPKFTQVELERRPEFAPAQPQAGPSRPAPPPVTTGPPRAVVPPAPASPLRTVQDADMADITMGEGFDGEFIDMGGESFFDIVDADSSTPANARQQVSTTTNPHGEVGAAPQDVGPSKTATDKPIYQHRQRPDAPIQTAAVRQFNRANSSDAAARRLSAIMGGDPSAAGPSEARVESRHTSAGNAPPPPVPTRPTVGAFAATVPNGVIPAAGQSARALAIQAALRKGASPPRAESPRIPAGGIDAVAAKATTNMKAYGEKLQLDEEMTMVNSPGNVFGGFASARGMKRSISEDKGGRQGSQSPTKQGYGARQALGEMHGDVDGKRARA